MTEDFEDIAARYEAQDPAEYLPPNTHPYVVAGYADFQKVHAALLRSKNANFLWLPIGGGPGGIVMSMHIVSHGTINIDPTSPHSEPIVDYRALSNPTDMEIMVENVRYMRKFMASEDFEEAEPVETLPGIDVEGEELEEWIRSVLIPTNFHPIATAAKKPREKGGVVDEELLVHGVKRLSVADGSIMPLLPGANTQQPVYMLAEKVSLGGFEVCWTSANGVQAVDLIKARNGGGNEVSEDEDEEGEGTDEGEADEDVDDDGGDEAVDEGEEEGEDDEAGDEEDEEAGDEEDE